MCTSACLFCSTYISRPACNGRLGGKPHQVPNSIAPWLPSLWLAIAFLYRAVDGLAH